MSVATSERPLQGAWAGVVGAARTHVGVAAAQWLTGLGNLAFAVVVARVLEPAAFADLSVFLGGYVLLHVPSAGIGAGTALDPAGLDARRRRLATIGVAAAVALVAAAPLLSGALDVPLGIAVCLAVAAPGAALLGLERGHLYARADRTRLAASLLSEPAGRLALGLAAAAVVGPVGAAAVVTLAGYGSLAVSRVRGRPLLLERDAPTSRLATTATFVLFAVLQQQDLFAAKAMLGAEAAGRFAAVSTAAGAVAFATATIPMTVLPSTGRSRTADRLALGLTAAIGAAASALAFLAGPDLLAAGFGTEYRSAGTLLGPYVAAMSAIGIARVLAARRCADGSHRRVVGTTSVAAVAHVGLLAALGGTPGGVVAATGIAVGSATGALALPDGVVAAWTRRVTAALRTWISASDVAVLGVLVTVATVVRTITTRGLWVDEAITVRQAGLPVGEMLADLQVTDVHPPLHHLLVWVAVRIAGDGELAVRAPSILAGVLLVPAAFGLANALYGRRTALVSAALVTVAPFAVWYSQEARMYSLFMLLATLALWAQVAAIRGDGRWAWIAYVLATAGMLWTQWFAVIPIAAQQLVWAGVLLRRRSSRTRRRRLLGKWAAALGAITLLVLPLVPIARAQLAAYTGRRGASEALSGAPAQAGAAASDLAGDVDAYAIGANGIWAVLGYHSDGAMVALSALWPLLLLAGLAALGRGRSTATSALLLCTLVPAAAFVAAGFVKRDLFELRYFAAVVPLVLVLLARTVTRVFPRPSPQLAAAGLAVAVLSVGLVDQQLNGTNPRRYDFEGAVERIAAVAGPDDVILYEPEYLADVVHYYAPDIAARPAAQRGSVDDGATVWVLATTRVADDRATSARVGRALSDLERAGYQAGREVRVPNVRVWEMTDG